MTSAAEASPSAILRFSSARASLTALARSSARSRCGAGVIVAVSLIWCFASSQSVRRSGHFCLHTGRGPRGPPPVGPKSAELLFRTHKRAVPTPPFPALPTLSTAALLGRLGRGRSYDIGASNSNVTSAAHALRARFLWSRILVRVWTRRGTGAPLADWGGRTRSAFRRIGARFYARAGSGPCSLSKLCLASAKISSARLSVA